MAIGVAGLRLVLARRLHHTTIQHRQAAAVDWRRYAIASAAAGGLTWGGAALLLMFSGDTMLQLFTAFVMAGIVAGAVPVLAAERLAFRAYGWPIMLAVIVGAVGSDPLHLAMSAMSVGFMLAATHSAGHFHQTLNDALRLEHEKDGLVAKLEQAREVAECSNRIKTWSPARRGGSALNVRSAIPARAFRHTGYSYSMACWCRAMAALFAAMAASASACRSPAN